MTDSNEKLTEAIRQLNFKKLKKILDPLPATEETFMKFALLSYHADTIVRRRPGDDGLKRDKYLDDLGEYYEGRGIASAKDLIEKMRVELLKIDAGYVHIHSVVPQMASAQFSPEQRISGMFAALNNVIRTALQDVDTKAEASAGVMGPDRNLKDANGNSYDLHALIHGLSIAGGDVLMLEAYGNKWFDDKKRMVLPALVPVSESIIKAVDANVFNAHTWRLWKDIDERIRYLGGKLEQYSQDLPAWCKDIKSRAPEVNTVFAFQPKISAEQFDVLANERFDTIVQQNILKLFIETNAAQAFKSPRENEPLPPQGYVSFDEAFSAFALSHFTKIEKLNSLAGGLLLSERLRGYAVLRLLIVELEKEQNTYFPIVPLDRLTQQLQRYGLTSQVAMIFIDKATFGIGSKDLYDQPLIKTLDGNYLLFGCSLFLSDLTKTMLSALSIEGVGFEEKGKAFERATIRMLRDHGFEARTLKVRRGENNEHEFDYDVAFTWEEYVFFIECKNRSIPMSNPILIHRFNEEMDEHVKQVERLRRGLNDYPDILTKDFPEAVGKKPIFSILNALPYSMGEVEGIYVIDDSILSRFFSSPTLGVTVGRLDGKGPQAREDLKRIWEGSSPKVSDFIKYLSAPPQIKIAQQYYEVTGRIERLSVEAAAAIYNFRRKDLDGEALSDILRKLD
ncbi:hypothetical protein HX881_02170 [Pseudomonas gingeri]|uniref:hypothetical protein n=1 Tax=Pseudomonas gingeri TaxID=117681 RepID=UPI0015A1F797|nr:hypothetical protein [Pseudomonas gingeri]NVZ24336.1 hypothetical protein [Pseudomonas gingeri]